MSQTKMHRLRIRRSGFTLVELMIALLLTGVVSVVIYSLFDTTSDNFIEVDNLADATDRVRFALERVRNDVQMAGAQMTPDSNGDVGWVQPRPVGYRVAGVIPYTGWQGTAANDPRPADVLAANAETSFDGIILMGAYDFPLSFEVSGLIPDDVGNQEAAIQAHYRGLFRLHYSDPFAGSLNTAENFRTAATAAPLVDTIFTNVASRLMRISDRQGYQQFVRVAGRVDNADLNVAGDYPHIRLPLPGANTTLGPQYKRAAATGDPAAIDFGLDNAPEGDIGYDAAFIDAFWYHVVPNPNDPNLMRLVRDRLCAPTLATTYGAAVSDPAGLLADAANCPNGDGNDRVVVAENVADFQVWFDCADNDGALTGQASQLWNTNWDAPVGDSGGGCMADQVGRARVAHVRLSLHTPSERKSQVNVKFEDRTGFLCPNGSCPNPLPAGAMLRTYDPYPTSTGAARVVTLQTDVALPNFANRNVLYTAAP